MKRIYFVLIIVSVSINSYSQEKTKAKEVGLTFRNVDVFGLTYRVGNEKALWRFTALNVGGNSTEDVSNNIDFNSWGVGLQVGREYRKELTEKMQLRYGLDLLANYNRNKQNNNRQFPRTESLNETFSGGIGFVVGLNYLINESFLVGVELLPSVTYRENYNTNTLGNTFVSTGFNYGLSNEPVTLSAVYRF